MSLLLKLEYRSCQAHSGVRMGAGQESAWRALSVMDWEEGAQVLSAMQAPSRYHIFSYTLLGETFRVSTADSVFTPTPCFCGLQSAR